MRVSIYPEKHPAGFLAWSQRKPREKKFLSLEEKYSVSEGYIQASSLNPIFYAAGFGFAGVSS